MSRRQCPVQTLDVIFGSWKLKKERKLEMLVLCGLLSATLLHPLSSAGNTNLDACDARAGWNSSHP